MDRIPRALWMVVGVLLLVGLAWWQLTPRESIDTNAPAPARKSVAPQSEPQRDVAPAPVSHPVAAPAPATTRSASARPLAPPTHVELTPQPAKNDDSRYYVPPPDTMLRDRRDHPGPHANRERVAVGYALDTLDDDIEQCLDQWRKTQVSLHGSLMLGINIDANGVKKAWVDSDGGIPMGPQSCFSNAVYGIDWSHMVDKPAMITRPYSFDKDGGS